MKKILVDTNAYVALLAGDDVVLETLACADQVLVSVIVLGELQAGFEGGSRLAENRFRLDEFLRRPVVQCLDVTSATAEVFGVVKHRLKKAGTPIPINDVWIAAHAIETGSWLVTYDRHFNHVSGLLLWGQAAKD